MTTQEQPFLSSTVARYGHGIGGGGSGTTGMFASSSSSSSSPFSDSFLSSSATNTSGSDMNSDLGDLGGGLMSHDMMALLVLAGGAAPPVVDPDTKKYMANLTHYLMGIGGSIVCCLGTVANAMSVAVLTRRAMKSSTYMYLAALAICDSLVLFFTLLLVLKDTKPPDSPHQFVAFHAILYPFVHPTAIVFQVTSIWLTLAFTVDRYIMICHPFKAEHMCRRSRARKVVVGIYVGGLLFNIPKYLEHYTKTDEFKIANTTQVYKAYGVMTTEIGDNELFREIVHSWGYLIFVCGIPFLTLVVLNAFLIRAVRESRLKGKEINPREKHRNDTTIMLIGVIIIFLICQGPALASRMTYAFKPATIRTKAGFTLNEVANFLVILNSAINIVPYYLFGRKFRSEFWRIFCACFLDKDEIRRIVRSYSVSMDHRRVSNYNVMEMNGLGGSSKHANNTTNKTNNEDGAGLTDGSCVSLKDACSADAACKNSSPFSSSPSSTNINSSKSHSRTGFGGRYLALPLIHRNNSSSMKTMNASSSSNSTVDDGRITLSTCCSGGSASSSSGRKAKGDKVSFYKARKLLQPRRHHKQQQQQQQQCCKKTPSPTEPSRIHFASLAASNTAASNGASARDCPLIEEAVLQHACI